MPTNEERREVAARLRDYSTRNFDESSPWLYMSKALTGSFTAYDDASDLFTDLADLIEPEPERTVNLAEAVDAICSEMCGDGWDWHNRAEAVVKTVAEMCGAKVVE